MKEREREREREREGREGRELGRERESFLPYSVSPQPAIYDLRIRSYSLVDRLLFGKQSGFEMSETDDKYVTTRHHVSNVIGMMYSYLRRNY